MPLLDDLSNWGTSLGHPVDLALIQFLCLDTLNADHFSSKGTYFEVVK